MSNAQIPMTNGGELLIGHWDLVIGHWSFVTNVFTYVFTFWRRFLRGRLFAGRLP